MTACSTAKAPAAALKPLPALGVAVLMVLCVALPRPVLAQSAPDRAGWLITPAAFQPVELSRSFANDRIRDALGYPETGPVRAYDIDLDDDGQPERVLIAAEKLCGTGGCPYTLLNGKAQKEIGSFFGTLVVLGRKVGGWSVVQALGANDQGLTSLTTYTFQRVQYQADDAVMIDEVALDALLSSLHKKP